MPLDEETKNRLQILQDEAVNILAELSDIFPEEYRFTFVARHHDNEEDLDIVLTNDSLDASMEALARNKAKMENAA